MKRTRCFTIAVSWLAVAGMCVPQIAFAAAPGRPAPAIGDIALRDGGVLLGQVVKSDGTPLASVPVSLRNGNQELAAGATNAGGYFSFSGLRTGTYQLATTGGAVTYQVWTTDVAPPAAQPGAMIVSAGDTVRGQGEGLLGWVGGHPIIVAGLIATAIAVPVAVANSHKHSASP